MHKLEFVLYKDTDSDHLQSPGLLQGTDKHSQYWVVDIDTLDNVKLPSIESVTPCNSKPCSATCTLLSAIVYDERGNPRRWKDTRKSLSKDGQCQWFGKGVGPVKLQVQAAMVADVIRIYHTRERPVNFHKIDLWDKVSQYLALRGTIPEPAHLFDALQGFVPPGQTYQSVMHNFMQLASDPGPALNHSLGSAPGRLAAMPQLVQHQSAVAEARPAVACHNGHVAHSDSIGCMHGRMAHAGDSLHRPAAQPVSVTPPVTCKAQCSALASPSWYKQSAAPAVNTQCNPGNASQPTAQVFHVPSHDDCPRHVASRCLLVQQVDATQQQQQQQAGMVSPLPAHGLSAPNSNHQAAGQYAAPALPIAAGQPPVAATDSADGSHAKVPLLAAVPVQNRDPAAEPVQAAPLQLGDLTFDEDTIKEFLRSTIVPGDQLVVQGASNEGPEADLGSVELTVVQMLGMGGNAGVFLAAVQQMAGSCLQVWLPADRLVVMKLPAQMLWLCSKIPQPPYVLQFLSREAHNLLEQELQSMKKCQGCPHVVQAYGLGTLQPIIKAGLPSVQLPVLLMEYCNLGSWGDLLFPAGGLGSSLIKTDALTVHYIVKQVVTALLFLLSHDILHRDVKPDNIMLQGSSLGCCVAGAPPAADFASLQAAYPFVIKLGDFGCACQRPGGITSTKNMGTPAFQAPELGCKDVDATHTPLVDVWSLCMSLLAARSGVRCPFSYLDRPFCELSYAEACQAANQRLQQLPMLYGQGLTARELEFVLGGLRENVVLRWTPSKMEHSAYITQGP